MTTYFYNEGATETVTVLSEAAGYDGSTTIGGSFIMLGSGEGGTIGVPGGSNTNLNAGDLIFMDFAGSGLKDKLQCSMRYRGS